VKRSYNGTPAHRAIPAQSSHVRARLLIDKANWARRHGPAAGASWSNDHSLTRTLCAADRLYSTPSLVVLYILIHSPNACAQCASIPRLLDLPFPRPTTNACRTSAHPMHGWCPIQVLWANWAVAAGEGTLRSTHFMKNAKKDRYENVLENNKDCTSIICLNSV